MSDILNCDNFNTTTSNTTQTIKSSTINSNNTTTTSLNGTLLNNTNVININGTSNYPLNATYSYSNTLQITDNTTLTIDGTTTTYSSYTGKFVPVVIDFMTANSSGNTSHHYYRGCGFLIGDDVKLFGLVSDKINSYLVSNVAPSVYKLYVDTSTYTSGFVVSGRIIDKNHIYNCAFCGHRGNLYQYNSNNNIWTNFTTPGYIAFDNIRLNMGKTNAETYVRS